MKVHFDKMKRLLDNFDPAKHSLDDLIQKLEHEINEARVSHAGVTSEIHALILHSPASPSDAAHNLAVRTILRIRGRYDNGEGIYQINQRNE